MTHGRMLRASARLGTAASFRPLQEVPEGSRYYLALGLGAQPRAGDSPHLQALREALIKELQTLPGVVMSVGDSLPTGKTLAQHQLRGFYIDGTIQLQSTSWASGQKIMSAGTNERGDLAVSGSQDDEY